MQDIDIMAPVGSYESLAAAIKAGASSVYFGVQQLNMRARASNNFTLDDLKKIVEISKKNGVRTYLTVNTVLYDHDLNLMRKVIDTAKESGISAIIASDISAIQYANSIGMEVHISTQLNVSNIEAVKFYSKFADVIVLARELTMNQIKDITESIKKENIKGPSGNLIKIELFVHGALCVAISGKCYMSLATENASANRGACLQNCRKAYRVIDEETGEELKIENKYIMSPKDLCTIGFIDKIIDAGVSVFKIEGRGRSPDYVYETVKAYKEAVEAYKNKEYTEEKIKEWISRLERVFNRGFWHGGYYLGKKLGEWSGVYGSKSSHEKIFVGVGEHYFPKTKIAQFYIQAEEIKVGDEVIIIGKTTGIIKDVVKSIYVDEKPSKSAKKGDRITIPISERVRKGDKLYIIKPRTRYQSGEKL